MINKENIETLSNSFSQPEEVVDEGLLDFDQLKALTEMVLPIGKIKKAQLASRAVKWKKLLSYKELDHFAGPWNLDPKVFWNQIKKDDRLKKIYQTLKESGGPK
mgnify:CR=1 FL=1